MRGAYTFTERRFTMRKLEDVVPARHPLREIRKTAKAALEKLGPVLTAMYTADVKGGRPSIAPEKLLRAMLLQVMFSVRSERELMEQVRYNLLFRWFIGLAKDDAVWVPTVFTKNRERLIEHDAVIKFFNDVVAIAQQRDLLSGEHFILASDKVLVTLVRRNCAIQPPRSHAPESCQPPRLCHAGR